MHRDSVSPDYHSRCRVSGVRELEFHRVKRGRPGRDQTSEALRRTQDPIYVFGSNGAWLRMRMKTVKVHQMQNIDEVKDIRPSIPRNIEWFMWVPLREICVSSSSCTYIDGDSEELDEEQTSRFRSSVLESWKGTRTHKWKVVEAIVETSKALSVTERRVRSDESESHQEEVKKPEEQASAVKKTTEFPETVSTTANSPRGELRSMCARMTARRKLRMQSSVETLSGRRRCSGMWASLTIWRRHQKDFGSEWTRSVSLTWMKCVQNTEEQRAVVPVPQMWKKNDEETQRISKCVDAQHWSKCWESSTLKSGCSNTFQRVCSNTVEFGVSNSSLEFERLRKQAKIAERLSIETVSNACQKSPTHRCITSTRTARRRHRLSKFHSNCTRGMNVDVLEIWRHTDGAASRTGPSVMHEWKETLSSHNDMCQRFEGYRSQYSDKDNDASRVIRTPWRVHSGKTGAEDSEDTVEATVRSRRCCWVLAEWHLDAEAQGPESLHAGSDVQEAREDPGRKDREASETFSTSRYTAFTRSRATEFRDVETPACTRQRETVNRTRDGK